MEQDNKSQNSVVQTYAEDMAKIIENDTEGLVKKIIHGAEEHEAEKINLSPESKRNKLFMIISILLLFSALVMLSFFFFKNNISTVDIGKQFVPIIFNDQSTYIEVSSLNKDQIAQTVLNEVNTMKVKVKGLEGIYLTENKQTIGLRRFISLVKSSFAPGANTSFVSDNFLMGAVLAQSKSASPTAGDFFILLKIRSISDIFDAMHAWETSLAADLHGFLGINASSDTNYLFTKSFEDGIIENKNARILYDNTGNIVLMYIFADDNSVIITTTKEAAHEIMLRLVSSQPK